MAIPRLSVVALAFVSFLSIASAQQPAATNYTPALDVTAMYKLHPSARRHRDGPDHRPVRRLLRLLLRRVDQEEPHPSRPVLAGHLFQNAGRESGQIGR